MKVLYDIHPNLYKLLERYLKDKKKKSLKHITRKEILDQALIEYLRNKGYE